VIARDDSFHKPVASKKIQKFRVLIQKRKSLSLHKRAASPSKKNRSETRFSENFPSCTRVSLTTQPPERPDICIEEILRLSIDSSKRARSGREKVERERERGGSIRFIFGKKSIVKKSSFSECTFLERLFVEEGEEEEEIPPVK
jgi:hypothetical protein